MKEAEIRRGIRDFLRTVGFAVWDLEQNRPTRQTPGLADLYVVGHGTIFWVECKTRTGRQTDAQLEFARDVEANGGAVMVWRSTMEAFEWWQSYRSMA